MLSKHFSRAVYEEYTLNNTHMTCEFSGADQPLIIFWEKQLQEYNEAQLLQGILHVAIRSVRGDK